MFKSFKSFNENLSNEKLSNEKLLTIKKYITRTSYYNTFDVVVLQYENDIVGHMIRYAIDGSEAWQLSKNVNMKKFTKGYILKDTIEVNDYVFDKSNNAKSYLKLVNSDGNDVIHIYDDNDNKTDPQHIFKSDIHKFKK